MTDCDQKLALELIDALEEAYSHINVYPGSGSPHYAQELDIPGIRAWPLGKFPYVVFYVDHHDHIDVWRVLHERRDIPSWIIS